MPTLTLHLSSHDLLELVRGEKIKRSILNPTLSVNEIFIIIHNKKIDPVARSTYKQLLNRQYDLTVLGLSLADITRISKGKKIEFPNKVFTVQLIKQPHCPICHAPLKVRQDGLFVCQNTNYTLCQHILNVPNIDTSVFSCHSCTNPTFECDCDDCHIYCRLCKKYLLLSCSHLTQLTTLKKDGDGENIL